MDKAFLIENCMHENPLTVRPDSKLSDAIKLIMDHKLTGLTVTDEQGYVKGVISELDCLRGMIGNVYNEGGSSHATVSEYMRTDVLSCSPDEDIVSVGQGMLKAGHRRRPVIKDGKLVGQLSCRNILWAILNYADRSQY